MRRRGQAHTAGAVLTRLRASAEYKQLCRSSFVRSVAAGMQLQAIGSAIIKTFLCDGAPEQLNVASDVLAAVCCSPLAS